MQTGASRSNTDGAGKVAHLGGVSSNTLFDILAKWNEVLKSLENPANDPERDICGVLG